ncbi:glycosyltransferase family A protein [Henriciella aquimarina]|uniref:glycosyltransferase family A protein n=1 Tax=Henriciella aquimarina TaxID=545261 RepID=UPI0009FE54DD|nr:glycosyltransferase family A protein [Henriciella aquimarina]
MTSKDVTVIIPTFNRPDSLHRAVESLFWQGARRTGFNVLVVDNSREATARIAFDALEANAPETIHLSYLHAPHPGVANARNAAMDALKTPLAAFLDDDQTAPIHWLEGLMEAYKQYGAAVTFGPVLTALPDTVTTHRAYFEAFFARDPGLDSGLIDKPFGCGNSLLDTRQIPGGKPWFDTSMNEVGGEDDLLFARIKKAGGTFAWAARAPVNEHPLPQRITLAYTLRRALAYGQGPCTLALRADPPRYGSLVMWMGIGAAKFAVHGTAWLGLWLTRHPRRAFQLDKAVRGLGKVLFWKPMRFYGTATVSQTTPAPSASADEPRAPNRPGKALAANR